MYTVCVRVYSVELYSTTKKVAPFARPCLFPATQRVKPLAKTARTWRAILARGVRPTLMANPLGDLLEWLFAANITTSDAFASAKALIEANVTRETLEQVITQPTH